GEDITITRELDPNTRLIKADRGTLEQVVMNLCINARDAMPNGGNLYIKTESLTPDKDELDRVPGAEPGEYVRLTVRDTGVGMSDEVIKQIYDPFFTTKKAGKGTGLGLSVVYGIVKQHKGWIHVTSQVGKGSVFQICLPVPSSETNREISMNLEKAGTQTNNQRILFIEDEEKIRQFTARGLTQKGFKVFCAATAREAEDLFDSHDGDFEMVVSDVVLPDQNGVELVEKFLKIRPELKVLLSSGYTDHKSMWPAIQEKGYNYLVKPYTLMDLINAINGAIHA
ncbi:MAG TPA: response regulator, partial [bacterium]|nr:response regulator [bacterium]